MKKMFFGALLFLAGFSGVLTFVVLSVINPWSYNDIQGLLGFLLGSGTSFWFILCCIAGLCGIIICGVEAYGKK